MIRLKQVEKSAKTSSQRIQKPPTVAVPTALTGGSKVKRYHRKNYFESEIAASLKMLEEERKDFMYFRVPDTNMASMIDDKIILVKAPSDYIAVFCGRPYFIECKSQSKPGGRYYLKYIKQHQLDYLLKVEECGGRGWFLLNNRTTKPISAYAVHPQTIKDWRSGMKSVKWSSIESAGVKLPRIRVDANYRWDLHRLFSMLKVG